MRAMVSHATDATLHHRQRWHFWTLAFEELHLLLLELRLALDAGCWAPEELGSFWVLVHQLLRNSDPN